MSDPYIRVAGPEDAPALLEIYTYYVRHTAITFEYDVHLRRNSLRASAAPCKNTPIWPPLKTASS